jgi:predicted PurR-regulated permease PerM
VIVTGHGRTVRRAAACREPGRYGTRVAVDQREPVRLPVRISSRSAVVGVTIAVVAILAQRVFVAAHRPLSWAAASAVVAILIDPIVDVLDRKLPRIASVLIALLVVTAGTWGAIYVAADDLNTGVDRLGEAAQDAAAELEERGDSIGQAARDVELTRRVDSFVDALDERVAGGDDVLASTAGTAPTYFLAGILTLFLMSYGPRVARSAVEQLPDPAQQEEVTELVTTAIQRARRAIWLTLSEAVIVGLAVAGAARLLDVPAPAALGLAAAVMAILPHVGLVLGTIPLVLLVLALRSDSLALAVVVVVVVCQLFDSYVVRPRMAVYSVHVGLLVPWVVALVGYAAYGVGGAAYGLAFAVFLLAMLDQLQHRTYSGSFFAPPPVHPAPVAERLPG